MPSVVPTEEMLSYIQSRCNLVNYSLDLPCWEWQKSLTNTGYGMVSHAGKQWLTHRLTFTLVKGSIPEGTELDHLCRNPACCNPSHLEAVSHVENCRRGLQGKVNNCQTAKTHCPQGHPYSEENTRISKQKGGKANMRSCIKCANIRNNVPAKNTRLDITHCPQGHEYTEENTKVDKMNKRRCKICIKIKAKIVYDKKKEMVK